jgi:hypothetical protein
MDRRIDQEWSDYYEMSILTGSSGKVLPSIGI